MIRTKLIRHLFGVLVPPGSESRGRMTVHDADNIQDMLNEIEERGRRFRGEPKETILCVTAIPDEHGISFLVVSRAEDL